MKLNNYAIMLGALVFAVLAIAIVMASTTNTGSTYAVARADLSPRPPAVCPGPPAGGCAAGSQTCVEGTATYACEYNCNAAGAWVQGAVCGGQNCNGNRCLGATIQQGQQQNSVA